MLTDQISRIHHDPAVPPAHHCPDASASISRIARFAFPSLAEDRLQYPTRACNQKAVLTGPTTCPDSEPGSSRNRTFLPYLNVTSPSPAPHPSTSAAFRRLNSERVEVQVAAPRVTLRLRDDRDSVIGGSIDRKEHTGIKDWLL